ncbi:MAG: hypothetical protein ISR77_38265 [Pirellulaceae bacterium]|nr:hypothetical protein [Pirellulaceae bacterium]
MKQNAPAPAEKRERRKRRLWPRWLKLRVVLALLVVLGYAGWRHGWPARSWETTVCPLEDIDWQTAARLTPQCLGSAWGACGARRVFLVEGSLDELKEPVLDLEGTSHRDTEFVRLCGDILQELTLPDLSGRRFHAGVFWVDMPAERGDALVQSLDPALSYTVALMFDPSQRHEDAAELIVDLNRNRDLTDDPVMTLSDVWSHEDENTRAKFKWFVRAFEPITLSRTARGRVGGETLPATVRALPTLSVTYRDGTLDLDRLNLSMSPISYRKGRITSGDVTEDIVISPNDTRFGRFGGPTLVAWSTAHDGIARQPLTAWTYERGTFWGCTLDADARELRDGPYRGPTGTLCAETASGESLAIADFRLWLHGNDPHMINSPGWIPIPRFPSFILSHRKQLLPVGDHGVSRLTLVRGWQGSVVIESKSRSLTPSPREFSIEEGRRTMYRLPKSLNMTAHAAIEEYPFPYVSDWAWSTTQDNPNDETEEWKGPQPGSKVEIGVTTSDPATGSTYSFYYRGDPPPDSLQLVIKDQSGKTVHRDKMEYG